VQKKLPSLPPPQTLANLSHAAVADDNNREDHLWSRHSLPFFAFLPVVSFRQS